MLESLAHFFFKLGGLGLLAFGALDSSFLFLPLGNDLLLVALTAAHHSRASLYVILSTIGSLAGVALLHFVSSKIGQSAIEGDRKSRQVAFVESKIEKYGGLAIGMAAIAPPGFPFTAFIAVPAALQYPLPRMLAIVAAGRLVRFSIEAALAIAYGKRILELANSSKVQTFLLVLTVVSIAGSAFSIYTWIRKSRRARLTVPRESSPSAAKPYKV